MFVLPTMAAAKTTPNVRILDLGSLPALVTLVTARKKAALGPARRSTIALMTTGLVELTQNATTLVLV